MAKVGAPTTYTLELAKKICDCVRVSTKRMSQICEENKLPDVSCINNWRIVHPEFGAMYATAKAQQAELFAEETIEIARMSRGKALYTDDKGIQKVDTGSIAADRLLIDTQKWVACKLAPRIYGDKIEHSGNVTVTHENWLKEAHDKLKEQL